MSKSPHCPICHQELDTVQFLLQANEVFSEVGRRVRFSCCGTVFYIEAEGVKPWYETKKRPHYEPHPCDWCGRRIDGRRRFCNTQCNKKWYYREAHPEVKRKTVIVSPATENKKGSQI